MKHVIFWTVALTALFYITAHAIAEDSLSVKFGPGIEGQNLTGATKMLGIRSEGHMLRGVYSAFELGGYTEAMEGRKAAVFGKAQVGVKPGPETGLYGYAFFGPCLISATDTQLATNFQFATDLGFGIRDRYTFMTVGYAHISNAGIKTPNKGRDYVLFGMGVNW